MLRRFILPLLVGIALLTLAGTTNAQSFYVCEGVDNDGYPITESDVFNISRDGGYVYFLTRLPYDLACRSVRYEIYRNGDYYETVYQDTERDWRWFWKKYTFYKAGNYDIYVYDCYDYKLTSGYVKIQYR